MGWQRDLSVAYEKVGDVQEAQGNFPGALKSYSDSLAIRDRLATSDPANAGWQRDLSVSYERLGDIFLAQGNLPAALEQYRASLDRMVPLRDRDPTNADLQRFTSVTLNKVGGLQEAQGNFAGALKSYTDSLAIFEGLAKSDPVNAGWQRDLSVAYNKVGGVQEAQGNFAGALKSHSDSRHYRPPREIRPRQCGLAARSRGELCKAGRCAPPIRRQGKGARLFAARPGNHGALDEALAGQRRLEERPRLVRRADQGAGAVGFGD